MTCVKSTLPTAAGSSDESTSTAEDADISFCPSRDFRLSHGRLTSKIIIQRYTFALGTEAVDSYGPTGHCVLCIVWLFFLQILQIVGSFTKIGRFNSISAHMLSNRLKKKNIPKSWSSFTKRERIRIKIVCFLLLYVLSWDCHCFQEWIVFSWNRAAGQPCDQYGAEETNFAF